MTSVATYRSSKELFTNFTLRELRSKYKRSFLGWAWSLATPLANMAVYTVVFRYFLRITTGFHGQPSGLNVFALFLLCALLPWNYFSAGVMGCIGTVTANGPLIRKTYFPRELLPAATVAATLVSHLIELALLVVALVAFGDWRAVAFIPFLLLLTLLMSLFALGFGLMLSAINVYFRDVQHFMGIVFLVWMYLTPIIYPLSIVPHKFVTILKVNPMTEAALCYRSVLYDGTYPGWLQLGYFALWALGMLAAGLWVFAKLEAGFAEEL